MELDANLITLQSVLRDLQQTTGDFSKIKYKGGNEKKISLIVEALKEYLSKTFPSENETQLTEQLQNITLFLIINTTFNDNSLTNVKGYFHLINVIPVLSKCLLANLIVELKLCKYYCGVMLIIPLPVSEELLNEMISCIRQCEPQQALENTYVIITTVIKLLDTLNPEQNMEIIDKIADIVSEMLQNIAGINPDLIENWKKWQIHKHMGDTLLYLLKLLRCCQLYSQSLSRITDDIIRITMTIMQTVTINVFCAWAEIKLEDEQHMQTVVAGEAYLVIEHLQKYKPGKELLQMLGTIAKKPKTINEIILEADVSTMVANINKQDKNQKLWFRSLMNTNVFQNEEALACLNQWTHLCTHDDILRLLNLSIFRREPHIKNIVTKCAQSLDIDALKFVATRYFCEQNIENMNNESVKEELTIVLNKTQSNSESEDDFIKDIFLLLLQNPNFVLSTLYTECLKKSVHTQRLKNVFKHIKTAVEMQGLSKTVFIKVFTSQPPTLENVLLYKDLLNVLLEQGYFQEHTLVSEIFTPYMQKCLNSKEHVPLLHSLQVLNQILIKCTLHQNIIPTIVFLINILEQTRYQFLTFSHINQQLLQETVNLVLKYTSRNSSLNIQLKGSLEELKLKYNINKFYVFNLIQEVKVPLLQYMHPTLIIDNHAETISQLMKLLSSCVTSEWILIAKELEIQHGYAKTLKLFHDALVLLCHFTNTQMKQDNNNIVSALTFCLQQYGIILKEVLQVEHNSGIEHENLLTKYVCCLLKDIPKDIRKDEGLRLIGLLSNQSLQSLRTEKEFVLSLIAIQDTTISQLLAQKMLT